METQKNPRLIVGTPASAHLYAPSSSPPIPETTEARWMALVANEAWPSWRALEPVLGAFVRETPLSESPWMIAAWVPLSGRASSRGGYLLDVLGQWAPYAHAWRTALAPAITAIPADLVGPLPADAPAFFWRESPGLGRDLLARRWGLSRGIPYARLRQMLSPPYVC